MTSSHSWEMKLQALLHCYSASLCSCNPDMVEVAFRATARRCFGPPIFLHSTMVDIESRHQTNKTTMWQGKNETNKFGWPEHVQERSRKDSKEIWQVLQKQEWIFCGSSNLSWKIIPPGWSSDAVMAPARPARLALSKNSWPKKYQSTSKHFHFCSLERGHIKKERIGE